MEVDVRCTADGVPILHHDRKLDGLRVDKATWTELDRRAEEKGHDLARVRDLFGVDEELALNLEIKDSRAVDPVLDLLEDRPPEPVLVTGFDPAVSEVARARAVRVETGLILGPHRIHRLLFSRDRSRRLDAWTSDGDPDALVVHRGFLRLGLAPSVLGHGRPVLTWTVNRNRSLRRSLRHPMLEGVITDRPSFAHRLRAMLTGDPAT